MSVLGVDVDGQRKRIKAEKTPDTFSCHILTYTFAGLT